MRMVLLVCTVAVASCGPLKSVIAQDGEMPMAIGILDEASISKAMILHPEHSDLCLRVFLFKNLSALEQLQFLKEGVRIDALTDNDVANRRADRLRKYLNAKLGVRDDDIESDPRKMADREGRLPAIIFYCKRQKVREVVKQLSLARPEIELVDVYSDPTYMQAEHSDVQQTVSGRLFPGYWRIRSKEGMSIDVSTPSVKQCVIVDRESDGAMIVLVSSQSPYEQLQAFATLEPIPLNLGSSGFPGSRRYRIWIPGKEISDVLGKLPPDIQIVSDETNELKLTIEANLPQKALMDKSGIILFPVASPRDVTSVPKPVPENTQSRVEPSQSQPKPVRALVGRWLQSDPRAMIKMAERKGASFGGWQTSDLTHDRYTKSWWSIGDQNCMEEGSAAPHRGRYAFRITLTPDKAIAEPIPIWWKNKLPEFVAVDASFQDTGTRLIDFEGIAADPARANHFFACTEGNTPWLVEMEFNEIDRKMVVVRTVLISKTGNHDVTRAGVKAEIDADKSWEGIAVSSDGTRLYLCTEWSESPSQLYEVSVAEFQATTWSINSVEKAITPRVVPKPLPIPFLSMEICGMTLLQSNGEDVLLLLERNRPGLYKVSLGSPEPPQWIPLDLRAPAIDGRKEGIPVKSASPEGIASDEHGKVVLISDPWAQKYRATEVGANNEMLEKLIPLVFELDIKQISSR